MAFTESEKSKVFVKITKTKVLAAYGQMIEVLFSSGKFPVGVEPTPVPENIAEYALPYKREFNKLFKFKRFICNSFHYYQAMKKLIFW